jgi:hypothetical protein
MAGRAKWDAWSAAGKAHENHREAEKRYLEIASDLGWTEGVIHLTPREQSHSDVDRAGSSSEGGWDFENSEPGSSRNQGGGGMGPSVSAMAPPPLDEQDSKSLHGLAIANNVSGLHSYLNAHPNIDVNELDEHVRPSSLHSGHIVLLLYYLFQGYTALHLACDRGNAAVVQHLLSSGADRSLKARICSL